MENKKIIEQINKFIEKSKQRKIPWKFLNQNLVRWVKEDIKTKRTFTITLQTLQSVASVVGGLIKNDLNYVLTVQATNPKEVILQVNTAGQLELRELLKQLFDEAMSISKGASTEVIDKLLEDL